MFSYVSDNGLGENSFIFKQQVESHPLLIEVIVENLPLYFIVILYFFQIKLLSKVVIFLALFFIHKVFKNLLVLIFINSMPILVGLVAFELNCRENFVLLEARTSTVAHLLYDVYNIHNLQDYSSFSNQ